MNRLNQYSCFDIIENNHDFLIINKHAGINVHKTKLEKGLLDYILLETGLCVDLCHRLDKDTSGIMVLGKHHDATSQISQLFANKQIQKRYVAISSEPPKKKQGAIIGDIVPARNGNYKLAKTKDNPSKTLFKSVNLIAKHRAWLLTPITGKTHQLRVILKSLGSPILGDSRYSNTVAKRMYLHCFHLSFQYNAIKYRFDFLPIDGEFSLLTHAPELWFSP
ncbi:pseudouridine synthase [Marinicellulosiphila megalodicopiae]|uniref:pseudouridine synthase n=1 Tax=Marinicellulosiphila megalodicopiae TaxID=2724896 RepID=UPI003BAF033E